MFTGIIETLGEIKEIKKDKDNVHVTIASSISEELKIDQSVSHNGVCLTVVNKVKNQYTVTAISETINKTNIAFWKPGEKVNLERGMKLGDRLDGHIVQGHVDQTGKCISIQDKNGSWLYTFEYDDKFKNITIEKGSITVNGVSLTVIDSKTDQFSVAIIPYTFENTNFNTFKLGAIVNLEFDVIGKYVSKLHSSK
jgi:riboflavin synthase